MVAYGNDFATAWYAVSLLTTAAVAGHGIKALWTAIVFTFGTVVIGLIVNLVRRIYKTQPRLGTFVGIVLLVALGSYSMFFWYRVF